MKALEELTAAALMRAPDQPAIEFEKRWYHWGELRRVAQNLGALIEASGAPLDAPVCLVPRNRPSALAALLGLVAQRRSVRMLYAFQAPAALAREVWRLRPAVLVAAEEDCSAELLEALREIGGAAFLLQGMDAAACPGLERMRNAAGAERAAAPHIEILTSGTTGPPKRFAVSYELIARHHLGAPGAIDLSQAPPTLLFFPLGNISGLYSSLPPLIKGQRAVLLERFSVAGWHDYVLRYRPEATGMPPAGVQMVLEAGIPKQDLACIRRFGTGAAPLDPTVQRAFEERYGIPILLSYGATEFGGPVAAMTPELHAQWGRSKFGSVGRALPGARLRVVDAGSGEELPAGAEGLLEVVSPRIGPEWIRTADLGLIDADGFLFLRGRADGAILRGGFKLLPETIESALLLHPAVSAAAVTGIPDARLGQVPTAAVQLRPGANATVTELETHLRQHLPATHIPAAWRIVAALPRTPSLKVDRLALARLFESGAQSSI
jgi:long-chain acyl-CoA synthetase